MTITNILRNNKVDAILELDYTILAFLLPTYRHIYANCVGQNIADPAIHSFFPKKSVGF
jgi:hypothetical protein